MRPAPIKKVEPYRVQRGEAYSNVTYGNNGMFFLPLFTHRRVRKEVNFLKVIISDGLGWDHVSVSHIHRTPTWEEMEKVRDLFFSDDETVVQFSVPREKHINRHPRCLHLWRKQDHEVELPPEWMV